MRYLLGLAVLASIATLAVVPQKRKKPSQYKRIHQSMLKLIVRGKAAEAEKELEKALNEHPKDVESRYMLALALAAQNRPDDAAAQAKRAIQEGLPSSRFFSGPRILRDRLKDRIAPPDMEIAHGPMIGAVTHESARVWLRMAKELELNLSATPGPVSATARAEAGNDFTAVARFNGLKPDTAYSISYRNRKIGSFRTSPPPGTRSKFTLAFGGGAGYVPQHEIMWDTIRSFKPRLMLLLGDNVYIDDPTSHEMQRYCYARRQSRPEYSRLISATPLYAIWDDHDFGTNDCWVKPGTDDPPWKRPVWNIFRENWVNPSYGGGEKAPGCWFSFTLGDVDFILLDGRYYRTDPKKPGATMLGPVQMKWLKNQLKACRGTFKVLCSPVPWTFKAKGDSLDTWNGYRDERKEIFGFIQEHRIDGVILLSADRHRSDAWRIESPGGYDLYEFNSSRLTNQHSHPTMKEAIFSYKDTQSFGLVEFDTTAVDPLATYKVVTIKGNTVHTLKVPLSKLKSK